MSDFVWDFCPRCGAAGSVMVQSHVMGGTGGTDRLASFLAERTCEACDGTGRVKVPYGYHLVPVQAVSTVTVATANASVAS